jgi:hypothetical protein
MRKTIEKSRLCSRCIDDMTPPPFSSQYKSSPFGRTIPQILNFYTNKPERSNSNQIRIRSNDEVLVPPPPLLSPRRFSRRGLEADAWRLVSDKERDRSAREVPWSLRGVGARQGRQGQLGVRASGEWRATGGGRDELSAGARSEKWGRSGGEVCGGGVGEALGQYQATHLL